MTSGKIWAVDEVAATNICNALGGDFSPEQRAIMARHLASHRAGAFDMALSRIRTNIMRRIEQAFGEHVHHRSGEWSEGCRSTEAAVLAMTREDLLGVEPEQERSRGQMLRSMLRQARSEARSGTPHR